MAIKKTSPRRPERRQPALAPEWHQRAYRAWGVKQKEQLTLRQRLASIPLAPKTRRMSIVYFIAAFGMILLLTIPLFAPGAPTPLPEPTPAVSAGASQSGAVDKPAWSEPPAMAIDPNKTYRATIETEKGTVKADLFAKDAPKTVNNFVFLTRQGFYDNLSFHRVINGFMAQGGDPKGNGTGDPGYKFEDEVANNPHKVDEGVLAMANSGPNTNGSQFFITTGAAPHLNGLHTVFGKVTEGLDVVKGLTPGDPLPPDQLKSNLIKKITIEEQ